MRRIALVALFVLIIPGCGTLTITRQYTYPEKKPKVIHHNRRNPTWLKDIGYSYTWTGGY